MEKLNYKKIKINIEMKLILGYKDLLKKRLLKLIILK